jgi:serine/threonine protein kinase
MFIRKPLLPGSSTMNQLERVLEVTGVPTKEEVESIHSKYAQTMIDSVAKRPKREMKDIMKGAPADAIDLVENLMHFDPSRRLSVHEALRHKYMASFYQVSLGEWRSSRHVVGGGWGHNTWPSSTRWVGGLTRAVTGLGGKRVETQLHGVLLSGRLSLRWLCAGVKGGGMGWTSS